MQKTNDLRSRNGRKMKHYSKKVLTLEQNKNNYFVNLSHELRTSVKCVKWY